MSKKDIVENCGKVTHIFYYPQMRTRRPFILITPLSADPLVFSLSWSFSFCYLLQIRTSWVNGCDISQIIQNRAVTVDLDPVQISTLVKIQITVHAVESVSWDKTNLDLVSMTCQFWPMYYISSIATCRTLWVSNFRATVCAYTSNATL